MTEPRGPGYKALPQDPLSVRVDTSTGSITARSWNFGDGSTDTTQNPAHTYSTAGTYTVSLTATGPGGTNTKTQSGYVTVSAGAVNTGLAAAYNFEEASGTAVVDASGKGNHGTLSGATGITQGRFGKALSFDGVDDRITVKDASSLDPTTRLTLEACVYPNRLANQDVIVGKVPQDGSHKDPYFAYSLHFYDTSVVSLK